MITLDMIDDVINKLKENTRECINISVEPCNTYLLALANLEVFLTFLKVHAHLQIQRVHNLPY